MAILRTRPSLCAFALVLASHSLNALQTPVGQTSAVQAVTVTITTAGTTSSTLATAGVILTKGSPGYDFAFSSGGSCKLATAYKVGDTCTVDYTFTPKTPGLRLGAVQVYDSTGTVILGTALISAIGIGPVAIFPGNATLLQVDSGFSEPEGVAIDPANNIFVADYANSQIKEILAVNGKPSSTSPVVTLGSGFDYPAGIALDGAGNVYVADTDNSAVKEILAFGGAVSSTSPVITIGSGFKGPTGVAVDAAGNVFVADGGNGAVKEILAVNGATSSTSTVITVGSGFIYPAGVAVDHKGNVFVADYLGAEVKEIGALNGVVSSTSPVTTIGSGFSQPFAVSLDPAGNVLVGDVGLSAVKLIVASGGVLSSTSPVQTVISGYAGPYGVATDGKGDIVFSAAYDGNSVNVLRLGSPPALTFAASPIGVESSDSPQILQLANLGNAPLDLTTLNTSVDFAVDAAATTCSTSSSLDVNTLCDIGVDFIPTTGGPIQGALNLAEQQGSGSITLYGTGIGTPPADPVISPGTGTYTLPMQVEITEATNGAKLYYVIDEGQPIPYTGAITVSGTETIRAYSVLNGIYSNIVGADYNTLQPPPATPIFTPNGGTLSGSQTVQISTSTPGTTIYYLLGDSLTPIPYTGPISLPSSTTIVAVAVGLNKTKTDWSESAPAYASFTVQ